MRFDSQVTAALAALTMTACGTGSSGGRPAETNRVAAELAPDQPTSAAPVNPTTASAPHTRETADTDAGRLGQAVEGLGVAPGTGAPDAPTRDIEGRERPFSNLWQEHGRLLLVFYRGGWCPYCNFQIRQVTESYGAFRERGVTPVFASVDGIDEGARTSATYEIPFPVLSDPDLLLHRAFNVVHQADAEEVERLRGFGLDIEASSGRDHHQFAVPSIFVVERDGTVLWAHVDPEYRVRPSVQQLLEVVDGLP